MSDNFWNEIGQQLDRIESEKPDTFNAVREILLDPAYGSVAADVNLNGSRDFDRHSAFFAGSGGDRTLREALAAAGWVSIWSEASYYYTMRSPIGHHLTYCEGDVLRGGWSREIGATA